MRLGEDCRDSSAMGHLAAAQTHPICGEPDKTAPVEECVLITKSDRSTCQEPPLLIILFVAFIAGHLLGKLIRNQWHAFLLSVPVGVATHVSLLALLPVGIVAPPGLGPAWAFAAGLLCVPIVVYGVFLAHEGGRRILP